MGSTSHRSTSPPVTTDQKEEHLFKSESFDGLKEWVKPIKVWQETYALVCMHCVFAFKSVISRAGVLCVSVCVRVCAYVS